MSSFHWILGGAALGVGVLWWRNRQAEAAAATKEPSTGDSLCAAAKAAGLPVPPGCGTLLDGLVKLGEEVFYSDADRVKDLKNADDKNLAANGEVELPLPAELSANIDGAQAYATDLAGSVLKFKNGCVPFKGAEGWQSCAPGTVDMWGFVGNVRTPVRSVPARQPNAKPWTFDDYRDRNPGNLLTGSTRADGADPATKGPFTRKKPDGSLVNVYVVRGKRYECPAGNAPGLWDELGNPIGDQRDELACAPNGVSTYQANWDGGTAGGVIGGTFVQDSDGARVQDCTERDLTQYTWDTSINGGAWRRTRTGEQGVAPPGCGTSSSTSTSKVDPGTLAIRQGGLARMQ